MKTAILLGFICGLFLIIGRQAVELQETKSSLSAWQDYAETNRTQMVECFTERLIKNY